MKTYIESFFDKKRNIYIMEGILLIMSLFLHWYRLDEIPFGIHVDEAGMGYDAWCLANFGVDRYLTKFPVYLTNFGGGQSALYAYLCALLLKMTGGAPTVFIMRMPAAIMGIIMLLTGTMLIKEVAGEKAGLLSMILFTICPYFMMQSRFGLDCNLMLPISTIALLFLVKALKTRKKRFFVLSGIFWGITCYAYAISYLIIPFFLLLTLLYLIYTKNIEWKEVVLLGFPIAVIALPLILFVMVNTFQLNEITTPLFTIPRLPRYRAAEFTLDSDVLVANTKKIMTDIFFGDSIK
ncbi:MAG: glycosyltransferase family 39 protein, partial [Lachnospiraceae bacterium]|nr:glycosyltransferase family 39 protein [Lachnospiraceae bacterium]